MPISVICDKISFCSSLPTYHGSQKSSSHEILRSVFPPLGVKLHLRAAVHSLHGYVSSCIKRPSRLLDYLAAILLCGLALVAKLLVPKPTATGFIPFILVAAAFGGVGPALLATVLCALISVDVASFNGLDSVVFVVTGIAAGILFEALRRSQDKQLLALRELAAIHRAAPVMLLIVDQSLRVRKANALSARFSGGDGSMWLGEGPGGGLGCVNALRNPRGCGHSRACPACPIRTAVLDALRNSVSRTGLQAWIRVFAGGGEQDRCLQISTAPLYLGNGCRSALICAQDITSAKNAELELQRQSDDLKKKASLIDLSHDAIIVADANRVVTAWNTGASELYGWTESEARGKVIHRLLQTGSSLPIAAIDEILDAAGRWEGEIDHTRRNGDRITVDSRQVLMRESDGSPSCILEINRDITERIHARQRLIEAHQRTAEVANSIADGFVVFDQLWRYTFVNAAAARMLHKSRSELMGNCLWEIWPQIEDTPFGVTMHRAVEGNVSTQVEGYFPAPLDAWFEIRCYPSRERLSMFFTDVTQRRTAEQEILRLNTCLEQRVQERTAQLEAANQELETFSYSVSHDLRAPLRGIDGWHTALLEDFGGQLDAEARHCIDRVRSEVRRMDRLIDDLLRLSRVTRAPLQRDGVDLTALASRIAANLRDTHPDRSIEFLIQPGLASCGDFQLLEIVFTNLLNNAVKFTANCPRAVIEVGRADRDGMLAFHVRDNGAGFDAASAPSLFGPFQRFHRASEFPGTGIGLATVQRIIHRHGGRIWADSRVGCGAAFYFTLG